MSIFGTAEKNLSVYQIASHRISIHEAQFDTIRSPALGFHFSATFGPRLQCHKVNRQTDGRTTHPRFWLNCSVEIPKTPTMKRTNLPRIKVNICSTDWYNGGIGSYKKGQMVMIVIICERFYEDKANALDEKDVYKCNK